MSKKILYLAGFMASGKSTIGPILANTIGWNFYDLDKEVEKKEEKKIIRLFEEDGEEYFRNVETKILKELSNKRNIIVSLGGGTLLNPENRKVISETGRLVFLKSSPEVLYKRLKHKRDRPVLLHLEGKEDLEEFLFTKIKITMSERIEYYEQADYIFDTDKEPIGVVVDKIAKVVKSLIK